MEFYRLKLVDLVQINGTLGTFLLSQAMSIPRRDVDMRQKVREKIARNSGFDGAAATPAEQAQE